jgi:hypothetical protein
VCTYLQAAMQGLCRIHANGIVSQYLNPAWDLVKHRSLSLSFRGECIRRHLKGVSSASRFRLTVACMPVIPHFFPYVSSSRICTINQPEMTRKFSRKIGQIVYGVRIAKRLKFKIKPHFDWNISSPTLRHISRSSCVYAATGLHSLSSSSNISSTTSMILLPLSAPVHVSVELG